MADTLNQQIADALTERQIQDARVETTQRLSIWARLAIVEADILAVVKVVDPSQYALLRRRQQAVALLMEDVTALVTFQYARLAEETTAFLVQLAVHEARAVRRLINATLAEEAHEDRLDEAPEEDTLREKVEDTLIPTATRPTDLSATGEEWWRRQGASLSQRIGDQLLVAVALNETTTQMVQRLRGTSNQGLQDGLMHKAKEDASRLLRTQVTNAVSEARVAVAETHAQKFILVHQSVLDSRTSLVCLGRNGLRFESDTHAPIGHSIPYLTGPPYHPACRSSMVVVLRNGGRLANDSASAWLRRRDTAYQDRVLGPTRAAMFRAHRLSLTDLVDAMTGRPLTLEELGV